MTRSPEKNVDWARLSALVADKLGLSYPETRWPDLERGLGRAASELGLDHAGVLAERVLSEPSAKKELQLLANHLTIGETYFFRDGRTFQYLAEKVLPAIIRERRGGEQRLRLWSAGCCTGEEAYSLAILVKQLLPDLKKWQVTVLATDVNAKFLKHAICGVYGEWSFREVPATVKQRYFTPVGAGRYQILPEVQDLVSFAHLNLVEDIYPSIATDTNAMDVVLCRNVLMYFTPLQISKVIERVRLSLVVGGTLCVSPTEASAVNFPGWVQRSHGGLSFYEKPREDDRVDELPESGTKEIWQGHSHEAIQPEPSPIVSPPLPTSFKGGRSPLQDPLPPLSFEAALAHFQAGRYVSATDMLLALAEPAKKQAEIFGLLARSLGNQGRLTEALEWCDLWIASDKMNRASHYLRAMVLMESGDSGQARVSFRKALYLDPDFVLAHFALGHLALGAHRHRDATRHFAQASRLLRELPHDHLLPESDGLTAGRLMETIASLVPEESLHS